MFQSSLFRPSSVNCVLPLTPTYGRFSQTLQMRGHFTWKIIQVKHLVLSRLSLYGSLKCHSRKTAKTGAKVNHSLWLWTCLYQIVSSITCLEEGGEDSYERTLEKVVLSPLQHVSGWKQRHFIQSNSTNAKISTCFNNKSGLISCGGKASPVNDLQNWNRFRGQPSYL